ncbi:hypothetical protein IF188_09610 [Microbacterium sp. NEAU-LLC]|uniref:Uncharacterized protein n=1 Tax=Microbacterium helvum TaxID=2773713 RepID=A0ABR8NMQ3_9MICO|nr:hypothetical protein [Microbacterium helvum]MBD3941950.1 hypothetical protein [Microbacterium helvum]
MAVSVRFLADVANWISGLGKSEAAVDDNVDALEDLMKQAVELGRQAGKTSDEIAQDFSTAFGVPLDRAKRAVDEVTDSTEDLADAGKSAASAGDDIASGIEGGASDASSSLSELGSIAQDVLSGDIAGAAQSAAGALGGMATAFGAGAGVVVGLDLISGAAGVVVDAFKNIEAAASEARETAFSMAYDVGGALESAGYTARIAEWTSNTDKFKQAQDIAKVSSRDLGEVLNALAMGGDDLNQLWDDFEAGAQRGSAASGLAADGIGSAVFRTAELEAALKGASEGYLQGAEAAQVAASVNYQYAMSVGTATGEVDDLGNAIYELPGGVEVAVNTTAKTATTDIQQTGAAAKAIDGQTSTLTVKADTSAWDNWTPARKWAYVTTVRLDGGTQPGPLKGGYGWD